MQIGAKVLLEEMCAVHVCKLRLFFERWTIADAVHKVEPPRSIVGHAAKPGHV